MRLLTVLLAVFLFCPVSHADAASELNPIWLDSPFPAVQKPGTAGFYPVSSSWVPAAIQKAAESVVNLVIVSPDPADWRRMSPAEEQAEIAATRSAADPAFGKSYAEIVRFYYVAESCVGEANCLLPEGDSIERFSGVLTGDGRQVLTALHVLRPSLPTLKSIKQVQTVGELVALHPRLSVFAFRASGEMIADPVHNPARLVYAKADRITQLVPHRTDDLMKLEFQASLGRGLALANQEAPIGVRLYHLGFSGCTGDDPQSQDPLLVSRAPEPNATGGLTLTSGPEVAPDRPGIILSLADGNDGISGGATVNAAGQLEGIVVGLAVRKAKDHSGALNRFVYSVDLLQE